jgi:hypothetical protein
MSSKPSVDENSMSIVLSLAIPGRVPKGGMLARTNPPVLQIA